MKQKRAVPEAGESPVSSKTVIVSDIMTEQVLTTTRHQTVGQVRGMMSERGIHSMPVVGKEGEAIGIVTMSDVLNGVAEETLIGNIMTTNVYTIPQYSPVQEAARVMRNHRIHHVVVTHEKKVVGVLSSFDLLRLVEDKRFTLKNPSSPKKKTGKRKKSEGA